MMTFADWSPVFAPLSIAVCKNIPKINFKVNYPFKSLPDSAGRKQVTA